MTDRQTRFILLALAGACCLLGCAFIPLLGVQNDEALFASTVFYPRWAEYYIGHLPLMLMSYIGTLKSVIYGPLLRTFGPTLFVVRLPVVLACAAGVWLFGALLRRTLGNLTAVLGAALLACDTMYLLTAWFDWGPVAIQHVCLTGSLLAFVVFHRSGRNAPLAVAFFLIGLGVWDKALFLLSAGGLAVAGVVVFQREVFQACTAKRIALAAVSLLIGGLPIVIYNATHSGATVRSNTAHAKWEDVRGKARFLVATLDGSALLGWLVNEDEAPSPRAPETAVQRAAFRLSDLAGKPRHSLMPWGLLAALLLLPVVWNTPARRAMLFALVFTVTAWLPMALNQATGGSAHHTILLWPMPLLFMAAAFGAAARRIRWVLLLPPVLMVSSLLVLNQYYVQAVRNGGALVWTDACFPLVRELVPRWPSPVLPIDWGLLDTLRLLGRGRMELRMGSDPLSKPVLSAEDREVVSQWLTAEPVFVNHTRPLEMFRGVGEHLDQIAAGNGLRKEMLAVIPDRNGRPTFEVFRYVK